MTTKSMQGTGKRRGSGERTKRLPGKGREVGDWGKGGGEVEKGAARELSGEKERC